MEIKNETIERLKEAIVEKYGSPLETEKDYSLLSEAIGDFAFRHGNKADSVSASTLKRLFGYMRDHFSPSATTLNILSRYVGFSDFQSFLNGLQSDEVISKHIAADSLAIGEEITLCWEPSRIMTIRYEGNSRFSVIKAEGTRIAVGSKFRCAVIISGEPLILTDLLMPEAKEPIIYIIGKKSGVSINK